MYQKYKNTDNLSFPIITNGFCGKNFTTSKSKLSEFVL